jgi:hypothetical protein
MGYTGRGDGSSKEDVKTLLQNLADEMKRRGNTKTLEPCCDSRTGKYLSFEEWADHSMKMWDKLSA